MLEYLSSWEGRWAPRVSSATSDYATVSITGPRTFRVVTAECSLVRDTPIDLVAIRILDVLAFKLLLADGREIYYPLWAPRGLRLQISKNNRPLGSWRTYWLACQAAG
jgi:hypothetical protein